MRVVYVCMYTLCIKHTHAPNDCTLSIILINTLLVNPVSCWAISRHAPAPSMRQINTIAFVGIELRIGQCLFRVPFNWLSLKYNNKMARNKRAKEAPANARFLVSCLWFLQNHTTKMATNINNREMRLEEMRWLSASVYRISGVYELTSCTYKKHCGIAAQE
jgi:hypothetical protein